MPTFGFDEQSAQRIVRAVKTVERKFLGNVNSPPEQRLDYPIPMFVGKLDATISESCSGKAIIWGTTQAATGAETSQGTSETVYDWCGSGGSSGDKVLIFRQYGSERLYFLKPGTGGGGVYGWFAKGGFDTANLTSTGSLAQFDSTVIPASTYAEAGVSLSTNFQEITFTEGGTYEITWSYRVQMTTVGTTAEETATVNGQIYRSTGSTVFGVVSYTENRFSVSRPGPTTNADNTPEAKGSETVLLIVGANHRIRFYVNSVGNSTTHTLTPDDATVRILKLANTETYATT